VTTTRPHHHLVRCHKTWPACPPSFTPRERRVQCPGLAIDLGSARTRAWAPGRGLILDTPTVTFPGVGASYPVQRGTIVDADGTARMLDRLLGRRVTSFLGRRPVIVLTTPVRRGAEHRAAALTAVGVLRPRTVVTLDSAKAVALGAGGDLTAPLLIVDVGAHLIEAALLIDGVIADAHLVPVGISDLDDATTITDLAETVVQLVTTLLRDDATTHAVDALRRGVLLAGGGALRPEIIHRLARRLHTPAHSVPAPHTAAVRGAAAALLAVHRHPTATPNPPR
jgi:rod shape-determining protein MreB and related proteins